MHLRRALLLFAVVLGLAALAASVSRTERATRAPDRSAPPPERATGKPHPRRPAAPVRGVARRVRFQAGGRPQLRNVRAGAAATVEVAVRRPGQVELEGLGLTVAADPTSPALFEIFETEAGTFKVLFRLAGGGEDDRVGTLRVVKPRPRT